MWLRLPNCRPLLPILLACLAATGTATPAQAGSLVPPPGYRQPTGNSGIGGDCAAAPAAFDGELNFPSKYDGADQARDQFNPDADAAYRERTRAITEFERGVGRLVHRFLDNGRRDSLQCAIDWYRAWADGDGLLGDATTHTGRAVRKWALASLSSHWLHLKFSAANPLADHPAEVRRIEAWLGALADVVVHEWDAAEPDKRFNNHYYWSGWAVMATAVALDRRDLFDWSLAIYRRFSRQIDRVGYLPNELDRKRRALGYHNYAITPMAMVAAFGRANGVELAALDGYAIRRLATRVLVGIADPSGFAARTGSQQDVSEFADTASKLVWLEPYCFAVDCSARTRVKLTSLRPLASTRLGGDMTRVFGPRARRGN